MSKHLLWAAMVAISNIAYSQTPSTENPTKLDYNIPSPNTAEFEKFGNVPVNMFTGVPNISVPIYTVKAGKYSLPVGLSYHAGGIRVDDLSGDAGLGWNLSAGYKITRVLRGKKDEMGYVGHNDADFILKSGVTQTTTNQHETASGPTAVADSFKAVADGIRDTQPDEFNFSIAGASGKFILSPDKVIIMPDQDIRVQYSSEAGHFRFILTDAKGIQYHFNDYSVTTTENCQETGMLPHASSWSISKIIYPDTKDSISFSYNTESQVIKSKSETRNYDYADFPRPVKYKVCNTYVLIDEKKLSSISFPDGKLVFSYTQPKFDMAGTYALSSVELFNTGSQSERKFNLGYGYYNSGSNDSLAKKLRLDSVYTITADATVTGKYSFQYNGSNIPAYQSMAKDHWGFYNGKSNSSLIPGNTFSVYDAAGNPVAVPGGNREPDPLFSAIGVLNKISYPTGGSTAFEYENNNAGSDCGANGYVSEPVYAYTTYSSNASCKNINAPGYQHTTTNFTAPVGQTVSVQVETNQFSCTGNTRKFVLTDLNTNQVVAQGAILTNVAVAGGHSYSLYTEADCTQAEANMLDCEERIRASITFQTITGYNKNKFVGGLRIKKITDLDQYSNVSNVRSYSYQMPNETDRSSGILTFKPKYDYVYYYVEESGSPVINFQTVTSYAFTSDANNTAQNNEASVVYRYVKETIGAAGEGGNILYNYSTPYRSCEVTYPFAPATSYAHRNGQLLSTQIYDKNGVLKQTETNYYSYAPGGKIPGWKTAYQRMKSNHQYLSVFNGIIYNYISEKVRLDSTVTRTIYPNDDVLQTQYYSYLNDNSYYAYKISGRNSQGKLLANITYRASDFNVTASSGLTGMSQALRYMQDNHLTDYPVESYSQNDGLVTGAKINEYFFFDNLDKQYLFPSQLFKLRIAAPVGNYAALNRTVSSNLFTLPKDSRYRSEVQYLGYNEQGRHAIMKAEGQQGLALIWGYGGNYPIASVTGDSSYRCAYTSFEPDATGNWIYNENNTSGTLSITGKRSYPLGNGNINWNAAPLPGMSATQSSGTPMAGNYIVSYWKRNGDVLVNGTAPFTTGATSNGWTYCEHRIYNPSGVTVSGNATIDELRFYAAGNSMKSFTYEPLKGMTSGDNDAGHISFFEYDQLGRLIQIKDEQGNIVKRNAYQYQGN